jgi:hypothetical protein
MVDENARIKKRYLEKQISRATPKDPRGPKVKVPDRTSSSRDEPNANTGAGLKRTRGANKGKERQRHFEPSVSMDFDSTDQSFPVRDMDMDTYPVQDWPNEGLDTVPEQSSGSKMPPPALPTRVSDLPVEVPSVSSTSANVRSHSPVSHPAPSNTPISTSTPISSSSRRPVLGMRRVVNPNVNNNSAFSSTQKSLPSRQKGFKPPFAKPSTATNETSSRQPQHSSRIGNSVPPFNTIQPTWSTIRNNSSSSRISSPPVPRTSTGSSTGTDPSLLPPNNDEADSSFGELSSFDMDLIEEAMKEYDK